MEKYYIYESKVKVIGFFFFIVAVEVLLLLFVMYAFSSEEPYYISGSIVGVGTLITLAAFWKIFKKIINRKPAVILESEYITINNDSKNPVKIALKDVNGILPYKVHRYWYLGILMDDNVEEQYIASIPSKGQRMYRINKRTGFIPFNIQMLLLRIDRETLLAKLEEYHMNVLVPEDEAQ
ncbi:STM3941 family protein [Bacillus sp. DX4.1]|uniref:STM3941 family protein n=1 Tax=Bacillus sp. DX4.1 TaxID=3055867 RepID=UPI0025A0BEE4|nr:STM3941 family protein [Bacillus sp. DX4.1]MDM5188353.1 STM3941 family protein [Bacillus sp. DX4.1]